MEVEVIERLRKLDDKTLEDLSEWLAQDDPTTGPPRGLSRRQLFAILGGAAILGAGGIGVAGNLINNSTDGRSGTTQPPAPPVAQPVATAVPEVQPLAVNPELEELRGSLSALQGENSDLVSQNQGLTNQLDITGGLLELYEQLEAVELDQVVQTGFGFMATAMGSVALGAAGLREGLVVARQRLNDLDQSFAGLDAGLAGVEGVVTNLSTLMQNLEDRLVEAGEPVAPVAQALGGFFTGLLSRIPGVGERIVEIIERVQAVIGAIPESIENINDDLITPMRQRFFPRDGDDITVRLIDPLTSILFTPAERLLGAIEELGTTWQEELQQPASERLEQRDEIRKQISLYKGESRQ
jgi:hypothetical protein